ncbi:hypothetical protein WBJ53_10575 [Spirosoma sp. SC4-14]|uniref:hypothetical protein n=1 Tax=Spirosoma sp. SC4-14 TaxID=3128900 RepID=UPI0030D20E10
MPAAWTGLNLQPKADSLLISSIDWESPAWKAGIRSGAVLPKVNDLPATLAAMKASRPDETLKLLVY